MSKDHGFTLKKIKTFEGHDGLGFSASIYEGKKEVATVLDTADGGMYRYHWMDKEAKKRLEDYVATLPPVTTDLNLDGKPFTYKPDMDGFANGLLMEHLQKQEEKKQKKACEKHTLFTLKSDQDNQYWTIKASYSPEVKAHLQKKYGENLKEIINERYLPPEQEQDMDDDGPSPR